MPQRFIVFFSLVVVLGVIQVAPLCGKELAASRKKANPRKGAAAATAADLAPEVWAARTLKRMTLREKVGQMIMVAFSGLPNSAHSRAARELRRHIVQNKVGGMIMYRGEPQTAVRLINQWQQLSKLPLIFASDFERGASSRMKEGAPFTTNMAVGATGNEAYAYRQGAITAREARAIGIHWVLAPVADVNNNPDNPSINVRSFGEDPNLVARMVSAYVRGVQENGAIATLKHFPGHGDTSVDSHIGLVTVNADRQRLEAVELIPFKAGISRGAGAVMTAHVAVPSLTHDPGVPATLSPRILTTLLREELGFQALVVTDALNMGGITKTYEGGEAAVQAVAAGADVLLIPPKPEVAINGLIEAVQSGRLSKARIDASVLRILLAKGKLGLHKQRTVPGKAVQAVLDDEGHHRQAQEIADHSITLLRNEDRLVPLQRGSAVKLLSILISDENKPGIGEVFQAALQKIDRSAQAAMLNDRSLEADIDKVFAQARTATHIVCAPFVQVRAHKGTIALSEKQRRILERLLDLGKPVLVAAFGNPYIIREWPRIRNYLITYSLTETAQRAAARAIFGEIDVQGKLPIAIPGQFSIGEGLLIERTKEAGRRKN
ncbi:MAG: glycoside hydrolase family 3 C-terminal domain-containing protein [Acidobacteria bacterium]|nr:glycoside hydrolase family 3 C-terminal domain-containing protein [Acidobacteriota bacterium]MBI3656320.1 glycoside hydrolase family 3 C-terminal domain-containing protein [Acidobacteriota bacterium]